MALYLPAQPYQWTFARVMGATLVLVLLALGFWLLYRFNQVVFILFIAIVMGTVIRPAVAWLHQRGLPRIIGVVLVYTLLLALLIGFGLLLFPLMIEQGAIIAADVPGYYQSLREWAVNFPNQWVARLGGFLPITLSGQASVQQTGEQMLDSADQALGYAGSAAQFLLVITAILLLAFHWTLDGPRIIRSLVSLLPTSQRERSRELLSTMETKVGAFVAGQAILCLIIGVMALVAYWLIGLPNFLVLAFIAGVMEAVPMVGPLLGAVPAALIALSISPIKLVWVIVASIAIQQLENNLLVPRVMRRAVGVNSFVSLLAIFAFGSLFGLAGAIMAIPLTAILQLLLEHFVFGPEAIEPEGTPGRDFASRLHYDAQNLAQDLRGQARLKKGGSDRSVKQTDEVLDEIEAITADLDVLLAQISGSGAP
jgi:predicted PurR-regulated permease PerM